MVEEKGFVMLPVTSNMLEGFISSKDNISANRSSSQSPVDESISSRGFNSSKEMATGSSSSTPGSVIETKNDKGILGKSPLSQAAPVNSDMKDLMNECENLEDDDGNNVKTEQGANFLKMDFSKPVISPAAKMASYSFLLRFLESGEVKFSVQLIQNCRLALLFILDYTKLHYFQ
ncbi:hypothetical protein Lser_V15G31448 [Lactuca serriola]